jgi:hypothetical protein
MEGSKELAMVVSGRVQNGVVVLDEGVQLPEGQQVQVIASEPSRKGTQSVLDIPTVSVGEILVSDIKGDDLLGEMLEDKGR